MSAILDEDTRARALRALIYVVGVGLTLYTLYYAYQRPFVRVRHSNLFLGAGVALFYLKGALDALETGATPPEDRAFLTRVRVLAARIDPLVSVVTAVAIVGGAVYVERHFQRLLFDAPVLGYTDTDIAVGLLIIAIVTDATRRAYGWAITAVVLASIGYALAGPSFPGFLQHSGMTVDQVGQYGAIGLSGVYGFILGIGTTWVAIFIMFAGLAKAYGALDYVLDVGQEVGNLMRSGVVQVAVIASMAMGSITGSAAANTATTGSFTIPMMKRQGVREDFAAAIESVASSGGQMMPPVMGVAAFIMADILQVPYVRVIQAGLLPALLFYFSVGVAVQLVVLKFGWTSDESGVFDRRVLRTGAHFALPLAVLVYTLVVMRLTPLSAGLYTTIVMVATAYARDLFVDGVGLDTVAGTTRRTVEGFRDGAVEMAPLVGVLASMGIIINMLNQTGLSQKISIRMVSLGAGVLLVVLLMAMVASILFGLGMPTPAAYILVVILVAPALIELAVPDLIAHLFVFYFAMLSAITPPVAVAVAVGSRIADAGFMRTAKQALRVGAAGFLIPFSFIVNPGLVYWSLPETPLALAAVGVGVVALTVATTGYDGRSALGPTHRAGYFGLAALALFGPGLAMVVGGVPARGLQLTAAGVALVGLVLAQQDRLPRAVRPA